MVAAMPVATAQNDTLIVDFEDVKQIVAGIRSIRLEHNIPNRDALALHIVSGAYNDDFDAVIKKMCNLDAIIRAGKDASSASFMVGTTEFAVPLASVINREEEINKIENELKHLKGLLASIMSKLNNEKFIAHANPEIVAKERKKQADTALKITNYELRITELKNEL